ncbi:MAG: hypothetical protein II929_07760 [Succinivibrio sp.]|nr:hypothetical protein [Succinivibrio sp.]
MNDNSNSLENDIDKLISTLKGHSNQTSTEIKKIKEPSPVNPVVIPSGFHEVSSFAIDKKTNVNSETLDQDLDHLISSLKEHSNKKQ